MAELIGERITGEVLEVIRGTSRVEDLTEGLVRGLWNVMDEDPRVARLYFDLSAVSVIDDRVRGALREVKARWRTVIAAYLTESGVNPDQIEAASVYLLAGIEGLAIERLDEKDSEGLKVASRMFSVPRLPSSADHQQQLYLLARVLAITRIRQSTIVFCAYSISVLRYSDW